MNPLKTNKQTSASKTQLVLGTMRVGVGGHRLANRCVGGGGGRVLAQVAVTAYTFFLFFMSVYVLHTHEFGWHNICIIITNTVFKLLL